MRVKLRGFTQRDADFLVTALNNKKVTQFLSDRLPQPYTEQDALWWINTGCLDKHIGFVIEVDDYMCGVIGVYLQDNENVGELGYWIAEEFWNLGYATAAVEQFTQYIFANTPITQLFNPVSTPNLASIKVMEKNRFTVKERRIGSVVHQNQRFDEIVYRKHKQVE